MAVVAATEAAAAPAVALALWWGEVADRTATRVEAVTEAVAVTAVAEAGAEAAAAQQQQRLCHGGSGSGRRGGRGNGDSSFGGDRGGGDIKGGSDNKRSRGDRGSGGNSSAWQCLRRVLRVCFFSQIYFLRSFLRKPHTDSFPDDLPEKLRRKRNRVSFEKTPQEWKKQESGEFFLQKIPS
jgi:hypothetical protein